MKDPDVIDPRDPLVRAKALYSTLKELGLPDDYVSAVNYLITEIEVERQRADRAEARARHIEQWADTALKELQKLRAEPRVMEPSLMFPYMPDLTNRGPKR